MHQTREYQDSIREVNGTVEIKDGVTYWMGNRVNKCPKCGIAPTNVDDCGEFGNPECPYFGIGREEYDRIYGMK